MQIAEDLLKCTLKGLEMSVGKSNYHFASLWVFLFFLSTSLKLPALLEEVRRSPSFVEEDFRLLWKIARHLELSERVRDLSFNFPLSSLPCCTTPSTSQRWCLACLSMHAVYLCTCFSFSIKQDWILLTRPRHHPFPKDICIIFPAILSSMSMIHYCWIQIKMTNFGSFQLFFFFLLDLMMRLTLHTFAAGAFVSQLPREY